MKLFAAEEDNDIRVLLDGAGVAEVRQLGDARVAVFDGAGELRERDDGHVELTGEALEHARDVADLLHAVLPAAVPLALHELEVVDHDEVELLCFAGEAARLRTQFCGGQHRRVIEPDVRFRQARGRRNHPALFDFGVLAEAKTRAVDAGLRREHANRQLLGRHFEREEGDVRALLDGGVSRDAKREAGLTNTRAGADDDEVGTLQAVQQRIEVAEAGANG